jgi:hypothetical protein
MKARDWSSRVDAALLVVAIGLISLAGIVTTRALLRPPLRQSEPNVSSSRSAATPAGSTIAVDSFDSRDREKKEKPKKDKPEKKEKRGDD